MNSSFIFIVMSAIVLGAVMTTSTSCSNSVNYDSNKVHHGKSSFKSKVDNTFFQWFKMRLKEGSYPSIEPKEIKSILAKTDHKQINSPADIARATWIGHATVLVQYRGINFLTDPHLTDYPSPLEWLAPKRSTPPALSYEEMPPIDFVVISHNHYDHLDQSTVDMFGNSVVWYVPLGLKSWFLGRGISSAKIIELDWWESHQFSKEVKITIAPNIHWSRRTPWDTNKSLWGSWAVEIGDFQSWFAGDTGYDRKLFKEIGQKLGPFELAMIPIGAYGPRYFMLPQHLDPAQAVLVHNEIRSQNSIAIHWGTFQLTHEPFLEPPELLVQAMRKNGIKNTQFRALKIGETIEIADNQ